NSPVTELDPDGTCFILCIAIGVIVFGGLGAGFGAAKYATGPDVGLDRSNSLGEAAASGFVDGGLLAVPAPGLGRAGRVATKVLGKALSKVPKAAKALTRPLPKYVTMPGRRPPFANRALREVLAKAPDGPRRGARCATCTREYPRELTKPRPWDADHIVKWRTIRPVVRPFERLFPGLMRRAYNFAPNLRLRCPTCNRADQ
ncbi:MAG TPA: hypothetical protein VGK17_18490, partial [Propionicimonas sp.]